MEEGEISQTEMVPSSSSWLIRLPHRCTSPSSSSLIRHDPSAPSSNAAPIAQLPTQPHPALTITPRSSTSALILLAKDLPEPQRLIPGTRHHRRPIGTGAQVKYSICMARQTHHLLHLRVFPHDDLILAIAMRTDDLIRVFAPCQIANLGTGINFLDHSPSGRIPEFDGAVCGSASRGE